MDFLSDIGSTITEFLSNIADGFVMVVNEMGKFETSLVEFDETLVEAARTNFANIASSSAVVKSVGLFHWFLGDTLFTLMYIVTMFGCAMTVYKLGAALWAYLEPWLSSVLSRIRGVVSGS